MSYRVLMSDSEGSFVDVLDYSNPNKSLIEPTLEIEVNQIGSFHFKMPPTHTYYNLPKVLSTTVEVYEDDNCIWFGRIISINTDYYRQKDIYCEDALGWLNDVVTSFQEYEATNSRQLFRDIILNYRYNAQANRMIFPGILSVANVEITDRVGYETTLDALQEHCLDKVNGYLFLRKSGGYYYLDWRDENDMPYGNCNQPIQFGLNMLDVTSTFDGAEIFTGILPYGDTVSVNSDSSYADVVPEGDSRVGKPLTLEYEYGSKILESTLIDTYGKIIRPVHFSGVKKSTVLYARAQAYLQNELYDRLTFECTAVDLKHYGPSQNANYQAFRVGQMIHCMSDPHALDKWFPLLKMSIKLDSPDKQITLGTAPRKKLTDYTLDKINSTSDLGIIHQIQDGPNFTIKDVKDLVITYVINPLLGDNNS